MSNWLLIVIIIGYFYLCPIPANAAVFINEVFPAPSPLAQGEWVELWNDGETLVDLKGYSLIDASNSSLTFSNTQIPAKGYLIATASSILNNTGDTLTLKDVLKQTVDLVVFPAVSANNSWSRCPDGSNDWQVALPTRSSANETSCAVTPTVITPTVGTSIFPTSIIQFTPTLVPTVTLSPPSQQIEKGIFISEVMVYPLSGEKEWVELYNANDFEVQLLNWYIDDSEDEGSNPKSFNLSLSAGQFAVVELSSIFNNSEDTVRLLNSEKTEVEKFSYDMSVQNKTWGRRAFDGENFCLQEPSKARINSNCIEQVNTSNNSTKPSAKMSPSIAKITGRIAVQNGTFDTPLKNSPIPPSLSASAFRSAKIIRKPVISPKREDEVYDEMIVKDKGGKKPSHAGLFAALSYSSLSLISVIIKLRNVFTSLQV